MKTYRIFILIGLLLVGFSCSDDFLEKTPKGVENSEEFYKTKRGVEAQIIAAYSELKNYRYVSNRFFLGDVVSDDATKGSEPGDFVSAKEIEEFRATASNMQFGSWWWTGLYRGIFYANVAIANIDQLTDATEEEKTQMLSEARFLRAYYYFELVRSYGGVPLRTEPDQEKEQARSSAEEVYALIEEDYSFAAEHLPEKSAYPEEDMGRPTKGAALSLLGKAYLYQIHWQEKMELSLFLKYSFLKVNQKLTLGKMEGISVPYLLCQEIFGAGGCYSQLKNCTMPTKRETLVEKRPLS